jgi:hypothetical protein
VIHYPTCLCHSILVYLLLLGLNRTQLVPSPAPIGSSMDRMPQAFHSEIRAMSPWIAQAIFTFPIQETAVFAG